MNGWAKFSHETLKDRFNRYAIKGDDCWEWGGYTRTNGYGVVGYKGKEYSAHRLSYMIHKGKIGRGMYICHKCDNKKCVNPDHLFQGTPKDNQVDCVKKGRSTFGERNGRCKLSREDVIEIRKLRKEKRMTYSSLALKFGISQTQIARVIKEESWLNMKELING